ncbi:hypothetical protein AB0M12_41955 [Nocardia vinacea]
MFLFGVAGGGVAVQDEVSEFVSCGEAAAGKTFLLDGWPMCGWWYL